MRTHITRTAAVVACLVLRPAVSHAQAQDSIASARTLYATAAYDDALAALNRLDASPAGSDRVAINQYRAFCLMALGRTADAEKAMEAVISAQPSYQPSDAEASPRVRAAFISVRHRLLPSVVQQRYADAKAAFDHQDFAAAKNGFDEVLQLLGDSDLAEAASHPPLADLTTLASGFRDLSAKAIAPPPPPPPAAVPAAAPAAAVPAPNRVFSATDTAVTAPAIVRQDLPQFRGLINVTRQGLLEIVINESGTVETAAMRGNIDPHYDAAVIGATRSWKFKPATLNGTPVKYRKFININLKPAGD